MKIHPLSDLHREFFDYTPSEASFQSDIVVLAGDIAKGVRGIEWARATWPDKKIVYVSGNHEYYGREMQSTLESMREYAIANDVHFLENNTAIINGVRFIGATMWTDFNLFGKHNQARDIKYAGYHLNDFSVIRNGKNPFTPEFSISLHDASIAYISSQLNTPYDGKTVVVSHHLPSSKSVAERWKLDSLSACFASDLNRLMDGDKVNLWIHGHTHDSFDYEINGTMVVCNPRGYAREAGKHENSKFNDALMIEM